MSNWREHERSDMMNTFGPTKTLLTEGSGTHVRDADGTEYLDFLAGIAVNALGHAHPALVAAITEQAGKLIHVSNFFATAPQLDLAAKLLEISGAGETGRVFFANSGTEANEAAFKLARLHGGAQRPTVVALKNAFHGRSMGALALTGKSALQADFLPMVPGVVHIDASIAALEAAIDDTVAAFIVEPIQGEAGVVPLPEGFLAAAREITQRHGALLIIDEIQTGAGRTGAWFGFQHANIVPDAITVAKGLGGGVPIGALVTFGAASELFQPGQHGTTFGGNPLACAAALAVLHQIEADDLLGNVALRGTQLREGIAALGHPLITGVRGTGLLLGIALTDPIAPALADAALAQGLIVNPANPSTIRLAPPLLIDETDVAEFLVRFAAALTALDS